MSKYWDKRLRQIEIKKLMEQKGITVAELALRLKISERTIQRDLEEMG